MAYIEIKQHIMQTQIISVLHINKNNTYMDDSFIIYTAFGKFIKIVNSLTLYSKIKALQRIQNRNTYIFITTEE